MPLAKSILVLGLGNPFLSDDTIGLLAVEEAGRRFSQFQPRVDFQVDYSGNFDLIYRLSDYRHALIIDSICTGGQAPGYIHEFTWEDFQELRHRSAVNFHSFNLPTVMEIARICGYAMPGELRFLGIEGREFTQFSAVPSWPLGPVLDRIMQRVETALTDWTATAPEPDAATISYTEDDAHV